MLWETWLAQTDASVPPLSAQSTLPTSFIGNDQPFMLVSDVSAPEEHCFVVEGGMVGTEGAHLVLEPCGKAVSSQDGREIFKFQSDGQLVTLGRKCVGRAAGHDLALTDCDRNHRDLARISWQLTPQNELKALTYSLDGLSSCLSLNGSGSPGSMNIAPESVIHATSSVDNLAHSAQNAIDGREATYWASELDPDKPVVMQMDLPQKAAVKGIEVKWECTAPDVSIETLGESGWVSHPANQTVQKSYRTNVELDGVQASAVRVVMRPPAAKCKTGDGKRFFGIRELSVMVPRRWPSLEDCSLQRGRSQSRWFLSSVNEYQPCRRLPEYHAQFL